MPEISTAKSPVQRAKTQVQKKDRLLGAIFAGAKTLVVSLARTLYVLWLQVTGLIFVLFAVTGGSALIRQYRADHFADRHRFWLTLAFTTVCAWFGVVSFFRAKKKGK
jgi:magnesium-transporting ATPase (P-type)